MQIPKLNGQTLEDFLKKEYPDIDFEIRYRDGISILMMKRCKNGERGGLELTFLPEVLESIQPDIISLELEEAVRKLREYCGELSPPELVGNPSSRRFGE